MMVSRTRSVSCTPSSTVFMGVVRMMGVVRTTGDGRRRISMSGA